MTCDVSMHTYMEMVPIIMRGNCHILGQQCRLFLVHVEV